MADGSRIFRYFEIISDTLGYCENMIEVTLNWLPIATYNINYLDNRKCHATDYIRGKEPPP